MKRPDDMLAFVRNHLKKVGRAEWDAIADATGVGFRTLQRIASEKEKANPRYDAVRILADRFGYPIRATDKVAA